MNWKDDDREKAREEVVSVRLAPDRKAALVELARIRGFASTAHLVRAMIDHAVTSPEFVEKLLSPR
jgi:hypothetical protein